MTSGIIEGSPAVPTPDHLVTKENVKAQRLGVDDTEQNELQNSVDLWKEAKKTIEDSLTPLEKYQQEIEKINKMQAAGAFGDDPKKAKEIADAAKKKAAAEYDKQPEAKMGRKIRRSGLDVGRTQSEIPKEHLDVAKLQTVYLLDIRNAAQKGFVSTTSLNAVSP